MRDDHPTIAGVRAFRWVPPAAQDGVGNFGDELGPLIARLLLEDSGVDELREPEARRLLSVGSVLHLAERGDVVWGTGINGKVKRFAPPGGLDVRAVRGPLTRAGLLGRGIPVPEVFGDPALLLGSLLPRLRSLPRRGGTLVVPNFNDLGRFDPAEVLDPLGDPLDIAERVAGAELVVASSLHALILADAFGVPSVPLRSVAEHPFKYIDYYAGTGRANVRFATDLAEARTMEPVDAPIFDEAALIEAFPWDLWGLERRSTLEPTGSLVDLRNAAHRQRDVLVLAAPADSDPAVAAATLRLDQVLAAPLPVDGISREDASALGIELPHLRSRSTRAGAMLSVVVPTHDVAPWVREALESVLAQDVDGMEVIVVDDHSTDVTPEIVRGIAARDPRVRLIDGLSRGGGSARNIGTDHARGKYIVFCDGDDIIPDGAYRALVESLESSGSEIAFGDYLKFRPNDVWSPTKGMPAYQRAARGISITDEPTLLYSRPCWNKVFARGFWESRAIRYPNVPRSNDIVPMTRAYLLAKRVDVVPTAVYVYRERPGATSMSAKADSSRSMLSYLAQETECARLVRAAHAPGLDNVYSTLVYDRDAYVHIARYLASWHGPKPADSLVVAAVKELLAATPRPTRSVAPVKLAVVRLTAAGRLAEARTVLRAGESVEEIDGDGLQGWTAAFAALAELGLSIGTADDLMMPMADVLGAVVSAEDSESWADLRDAAGAFLGARSLTMLPEAGVARKDLPSLIEARNRAQGQLTFVNGGQQDLVIGGVSQIGEDSVLPVLHDGEFAGSPVIEPISVRWEHADGGEWHWVATYPLARIPMHRPLAPALRHLGTGLVGSIGGRPTLPEYEPKDRYLYDQHESVTRVRRRRHWAPRAGRRALLIARDRLRS